MRIAISADNDGGLESPVSPHFGRCPYFVLVDTENGVVGGVDTVPNPYFGNHQPGQVPAFVHSLGVQVMLSGGMGAGAVSYFNQYDIEVATGASGTVGQALDSYLAGSLRGTEPCCPDDGGHHHHG